MSAITGPELHMEVRSAPSVRTSTTCREALRVMFEHPESKCIVVCDPDHKPLGLLMNERFFLTVTGRFDSFCREPVSKLMNPRPLIVDIHAPLESVMASAKQRPAPHQNDCIIAIRDGRYTGIISPHSLS